METCDFCEQKAKELFQSSYDPQQWKKHLLCMSCYNKYQEEHKPVIDDDYISGMAGTDLKRIFTHNS
jgi:thioredoxin-related protein